MFSSFSSIEKILIFLSHDSLNCPLGSSIQLPVAVNNTMINRVFFSFLASLLLTLLLPPGTQ